MKLNVKDIDLSLDLKTNKLYSDGINVTSSTRRVEELKNVLLNKNFINKNNRNDILYYMFRAAGQNKEQTIFDAHNIRYDVTLLLPYGLGGEFNKTLGHYHPLCKDNLSFPELYEVISGEVMYLFQKRNEDGHYDVKLVHAKKGDKVLVEPNYGHITINIGKDPVVMSNLVNSTFQSDYRPMEQMYGGAVYITDKKTIVLNQNYKDVSIFYAEAKKLEFLDYSKSIYDEYIAHPEHFIFLNNPEFLLWKHDAWDLQTQHF